MKTLNVVAASPIVAVAMLGLLSLTSGARDLDHDTSIPQPGEPTLADVRKATERYRDVAIALADGYVRDPFDLCDTAEMMGRPPRSEPWACIMCVPIYSESPLRPRRE